MQKQEASPTFHSLQFLLIQGHYSHMTQIMVGNLYFGTICPYQATPVASPLPPRAPI